MVNKVSSFLVNVDRICDYIPIVSTVTNLVDLFQKAVFSLSGRPQSSSLKNNYFKHITSKKSSHCALFMVPVIGNLAAAIFNKGREVSARQEGVDFSSALELWTSLSDDNRKVTDIILQAHKIKANSLCLVGCNLTSVTKEIGRLTQLKYLNLGSNQLTTLPAELGNLTQLKDLHLTRNNLTSLPISVGSLTKLQKLDLKDNPNLTELPLSLGQIRKLIEIDIEGTGISEESRDEILRQCQALRAEKALQVISSRLTSWGLKSKMAFDFSQVLEFEGNKKQDINEWLIRLENTKDFNSQFQTTLAKTVCEMLVDATKNEDFRVSFFAQIAANLECCQDRAAMALNEIFTSWQLSQLDDSIPLDERLQIMARGAKTQALRAAIAKHIDQHQRKSGSIEREAVEIYLYYETTLKNELNLLSIIENMAYGRIGQRDWIRKDDLIREVNASYLDHLVELDSFKKIVEVDLGYKAVAKKKLEFFDSRIGEVKEPADVGEFSEKYLNWQSEMGKLKVERERVEADLKKEWARKMLSKDSFRG